MVLGSCQRHFVKFWTLPKFCTLPLHLSYCFLQQRRLRWGLNCLSSDFPLFEILQSALHPFGPASTNLLSLHKSCLCLLQAPSCESPRQVRSIFISLGAWMLTRGNMFVSKACISKILVVRNDMNAQHIILYVLSSAIAWQTWGCIHKGRLFVKLDAVGLWLRRGRCFVGGTRPVAEFCSAFGSIGLWSIL